MVSEGMEEVSWLRVLLDNNSSYLRLLSSSSSRGDLYSNPAHNYYTRGEAISKLLQPVLENLVGSDAAPGELLNNGFEELAQYIDELREEFQSWQQPLSSRILYVLRIETLASKLRESSLEVFQLLKHCEQHLPADLISPSFEECIELVKSVAREEISYTTNQVLKDESKGVEPTSEVLLKIAKSVGLRSNLEILIEGVVLSNMKENTNNSTEAEYLEGLISLTTRMHDYLWDIKQAQLRCPVVCVPPDFSCSLSLELMTDPVIVASGQTYERVFIQKWIDMGLMFCPKTRQALSHTALTPNVIVRAFIASWCETNNVYPPDPLELIQSTHPFPLLFQSDSLDDGKEVHHQVFSRSASAPGIVSIRETGSSSSIETEVKKLIEDLKKSSSLDTEREATARIRILSRNSTDNRIVIARCGAIPSLVNLLYSTDERIQADAVTCLLNLSINDNNKSLIAESGAIEPLIHVLKTGDMEEAKTNAAATLFSLSVIEEYKTKIGNAGAIEPLVDLLGNATSLSGKKDAATALFNLSIHHENKSKVIEAGAVRYLVELMDPAFGMVERAVVVLANLATVREGKIAIGEEGGIPVLVEVVELGSSRGKENATAALLQLSMHSPKFCNTVIREGVIPPLVALTKSGTARGKEKAQNLLKYFKAQKQGNQRRA